MENPDRLFRDAERIKASEGLWNRIAEGSGLAAGADGKKSREAGHDVRGAGRRGKEWAWRMAASFAVGLGVLAALFVWTPGPGNLASKLFQGPDREAASISGGAEDFSSEPVASAEARAEQVLPDREILEWHADLGEVTGWDDDALIAEPLEEE